MKINRLGHINTFAILLSALFVTQALADEASLKKAVEAAYPKMKVENITKTPYAGLYEVYMGGQIIYTDDKFSFLIAEGHLVDTKSKQDMTTARLDDLNRIDFSQLPLDQAIKVVKGNGSRKMAVFADADCPYCKHLEQNELSKITDVTVYTFLYPLEQLHPDSVNKSKAVWCAPDKSQAWMNWAMRGQLPTTGNSCETPLDKNAALGRKIGVTSTPTIFFADGKRMLGAYPYAEIEKALVASAKK